MSCHCHLTPILKGAWEYALYEHYLIIEKNKLIYDIRMNCGCSREEIEQCEQQILEIERGVLKLLHDPIISVPLL